MIPAGYLLKRIVPPPERLSAPNVTDICSLSDCVSGDAVELQSLWQHNGFGLASTRDLLWRLASENGIDTLGAQLFYYEVFEQEMDSEDWLSVGPNWRPLTKLPSSESGLMPPVAPKRSRLLGYDVVTSEDFLEHSPLSCNSMAQEIPVNSYCLLSSLEQAQTLIETGAFKDCEPGIYKIYSVYAVDE